MGARARQFRTAADARLIANGEQLANPTAGFPIFSYEQAKPMNTPSMGYGGEPTQTATRGVFEALWTGPQEAPLSPRNCA
jgi:hypothetical protein